MIRTVQLKPNVTEILAKERKKELALKYGWTYLDGLRPGESGVYVKGNKRLWATTKHYVRAELNLQRQFTNHQNFTSLEDGLR